jgi:hypothetical protein
MSDDYRQHHYERREGADYLLAVKNNQMKLSKTLENAFAEQRKKGPEKRSPEKGHGRDEYCQIYVMNSTLLEDDFSRRKGLNSLIMTEYAPGRKNQIQPCW